MNLDYRNPIDVGTELYCPSASPGLKKLVAALLGAAFATPILLILRGESDGLWRALQFTWVVPAWLIVTILLAAFLISLHRARKACVIIEPSGLKVRRPNGETTFIAWERVAHIQPRSLREAYDLVDASGRLLVRVSVRTDRFAELVEWILQRQSGALRDRDRQVFRGNLPLAWFLLRGASLGGVVVLGAMIARDSGQLAALIVALLVLAVATVLWQGAPISIQLSERVLRVRRHGREREIALKDIVSSSFSFLKDPYLVILCLRLQLSDGSAIEIPYNGETAVLYRLLNVTDHCGSPKPVAGRSTAATDKSRH